jgi:trimeric autotransporter adhesin
MSTKTTFKRVALVAVAALGLGVLSVVPSQAAITGVTTTVTAGTAGQVGARSDSSTGAQISVSALYDAGTADTMTVQFIQAAAYPVASSGTTTVVPVMKFLESTTASTAKIVLLNNQTTTDNIQSYVVGESVTAGRTWTIKAEGASAQYAGAKFALELDSISSTNRTPGTYSFTIITKTYASGILTATASTPATITVAALASQSATASSATSTAVLSSGSSYAPATAGVDDVVGALATASTTAAATLRVSLLNAGSGNAQESITATITGPGVIGDGTTFGKSVVVAYTAANRSAGYKDLSIRPDGSAGVATVNVSSTSVTFAPKTLSFFAKSPKTITAAVYNPVLNVGTNGQAVAATAVDANGTAWTGALYIKAVAAADALVGGSATDPVLCTYTASVKTHFCPITTLIAGTAKFVVVDESLDTDAVYAAADSAATSNEVTVTASAGTPTTVKLAFDKATYAPFEKALITVTPLDAAGKTMGSRAITNLFATGGITSNVAFGSASDTLTAVTRTTAAANDTDVTAGAYTYVVYMPAQGDVTISATGGTGLAAAGQVKVTATASVVNSSVDAATDAANEATDAANAATDAALAAADAADAATAAAQDASDAVAALSASVSKLISSLRAQITSLTNLVIKIQKKVRA